METARLRCKYGSAPGADPLEELRGEVLCVLGGFRGGRPHRAEAVEWREAEPVRGTNCQRDDGHDCDCDYGYKRHIRWNTVAIRVAR